MLRQRVLTALILAPLVVWAILTLPTTQIALLFGGVILLAAWEWGHMVAPAKPRVRILYTLAVTLTMVALHRLLPLSEWSQLPWLGILWLGIISGLILNYPRISPIWGKSGLLKALVGLIVLLPAWVSLIEIHRLYGPGYLILLMLLIWGADTGAYFVGRRFGRRKLAAAVSPGKSWEGAIGGAVVAVAVAMLLVQFLQPVVSLPTFALLALVTVTVSVIGDLGESLFKRIIGIKDSSSILPGHGGILDRIDSLTTAAPLFCVGLGVLA